MKTYISRMFTLASVIILSACNSGNSASGGSAAQVTNSLQSFSSVHQLATGQNNSCITISSFTPSIGAWWVSAGFSLKNTCATTQSVSGVQLLLSANQPLNPAEWSLNNISYPVWKSTTTTLANRTANILQITLNTTAVLPANGVASGSFGYNPAGTTLSGLTLAVNGIISPVANASLQATINSSSLTKVCSGTTSCNIPIQLLGQGGTFYQTVATLSNTNLANSSITLTNLLPGNYTIAASGLPRGVTESTLPSSTVTLTANTTSNVTLNFNTQAANVGSLSFNLINPDSSTFKAASLPSTLTPSQSGSVLINQATFNTLTTVNGLSAESYALTLPGLASASKGEYYNYPNLTALITPNSTTSLGNLVARGVTTTTSDTFKVSGLAVGDRIIFNFTDNINGNSYIFNSESLTATESVMIPLASYKFINGDNITVNITLSNKYTPLAPFSFTQGASSQVFSFNLSAAPVVSSGTLYFHVGNLPTTSSSAFGDSMPLAGDNYTDLIMSNYIAGVMLGHLIDKNFPGMQYNPDYLYGSLFAQLLQENIDSEAYESSSNLIAPLANQIADVMSAGQGGPYQDNSYANDMVNDESGGHALINYVALQRNLGYTISSAKAQSSLATPAMFNNKYFGPMIIAYFQLIDLVSLEYTENGADGGWISSATPNYPKCMQQLTSIANSPLDIIMNYAYNQGFQGGLVNAATTDCINYTPSTFLAKYNSFSNSAGSSFNDYPYQVRFYLNELYNQSTLLNVAPVHVAVALPELVGVFVNVFTTLSYVNTAGAYVTISQSQANTAFNQALTALNLTATRVLDLSDSTQRQLIFSLLKTAISTLETNLGTNFSATTLTQLSPSNN